MRLAKDKTYQLLLAKMHEVTSLPPQDVGPFTLIYKEIVRYFKFYLWRTTSAISFFTAILLYLFLGSSLVRVVSLLQFGF